MAGPSEFEIWDASDSDRILIDASKLELNVRKCIDAIEDDKNIISDIVGSAGILVSIILSLCTSTFHDFLKITGNFWKELFIFLFGVFLYRTISLIYRKYRNLRNHKNDIMSADELIDNIKRNSIKSNIIKRDVNKVDITDIK